MTIEITKGSDNPVAEFFSSPSNTPEIDEVEKYSGVTIKDSVTTCGDESSSVYIPVIFARQLERKRDEWAAMCGRYKQERDEAREQLIHLRSCVYDVIHSLKAGAFDELEKAWKEGLK